MSTMTEVIENALTLPLSERSYIAARLIESLEDDHELSPEWMEEIEKRVGRRQRGETQSVSHEDVHRDIERILA